MLAAFPRTCEIEFLERGLNAMAESLGEVSEKTKEI